MAASYQMLFELNAALGGGFASAFTSGGQQIDNMKAKLDALNAAGSTGDLMGGISAALQTAGVMKGLEVVYETLQECSQASIEFESAMTGVSKTTDMSASELDTMSEAVKQLSTEIPVTTTELASVMEVAGQLGIGKDDLLEFSTVMSQLSTATTMTADEAATMLAQFANITQMDPSQYSNLASAVVDLGNNYATTEQKIVEMGQGIAAAGSLAGMSEADMMGLSAAVTSLGIETAAGSTSMSKLITKLNTAVETGDGLSEFASVAGMSAAQFSEAWGNDAANALATFITGLSDVERNGASASVILGELGITEARMQRMVLSLAGSGSLMSNAIRDANAAFEENTALTAEAEKRYATTESRLKMMENAANNVKISIGDALTPMIASAAEGITGLLQPLSEFIGDNPAIVQGLTAFVGVLGLATAAVTAYTAVTKLASAANMLFGASIPGVGVIMGVAAAVGGLVFGISALTDAYNDAHPSFEQLDEEFDQLNEQAKEQQDILDLIQEYRDLSADIAATEAAMKFKAELDIGDVSEENLALIDELKGKMEDKTAELKQTLVLAGADDITDEDMARLVELASNAQTSDDTLKQTLELMGVENVTPEMIQRVRDFAGAISTESGKLEQELRLIGFDDATVTGMGYGSYKEFVNDVAAGKVVINADGTITERLDLGGVAPTDLELMEEIAANNGYVVTADGKVTQSLDIGEVKEKDLKTLQTLKENISNETAKLSQTMELIGVDDVTPENLQRYLDLKVNTKEGDYELRQMLELDGAENATPQKINQIKNFIKNVQSKEGKVTQKLEAIVSTEQIAALGYSSMDDFVDAVNAGKVVINADGTVTQTIDVSGDVAELKQIHEDEVAIAEAEAAAGAAAEELAGKRARLSEVTGSLRDSSDGLVTATDEETEALNRQLEAYEKIAEAKKEEAKGKIKQNVYAQAEAYVQSSKTIETAQKTAAAAQKEFDKAVKWNTEGPEALKNRIVELSTEMQTLASTSGGDLANNTAFQNARNELEGIIELYTGQDKNYAASAWDMMIRDANNLSITGEGLNGVLLTASNRMQYYTGNVQEADNVQQTFIDNLVSGMMNGTIEAQDLQETLNLAFKDYENSGEIVAGIMAEVTAGVEAAKAAATGSGAQAQTEAETAVAAVGSVIERMEALKAAYEEAKKAAKEALGGRFGLFGEVGDTPEGQTTGEMEANMTAQKNYWDQYNTNLQSALDKGLAPQIAKQLTDGSAESAAALAELANASSDEIQKINDKFAEVEASKDTLASTIADMQTNFTEGMEALKTELEDTVKELDKGSEAAAAAANTMSAYVGALGEAEDGASQQASAIADAVNAALATIADVDVNITYHYTTEGSPPADASGAQVEGGNAIGTDFASRGIHLVGEEGPELVFMHGGEKVLTANETVNALSGMGGGGGKVVEVAFSPIYNISGGDVTGIRAVLEEQSQNLREQIEGIMEDVVTDRMRTAYA